MQKRISVPSVLFTSIVTFQFLVSDKIFNNSKKIDAKAVSEISAVLWTFYFSLFIILFYLMYSTIKADYICIIFDIKDVIHNFFKIILPTFVLFDPS